jgi:hypothetical protein
MPKGSIRNPGARKAVSQRSNEAVARVAAADKARSQRKAKAANEWDEYRSVGHDAKSLRKSMRDVRAEPGSLKKKTKAPVGKGGR